MLTGSNLRKKDSKMKAAKLCVCVLSRGVQSHHNERLKLRTFIWDDVASVKCEMQVKHAPLSFVQHRSYSLLYALKKILQGWRSTASFFPRSFIRFGKIRTVLRCLWINSVAPMASSLVWVTQLRSYLELN